MSEFRRKLLMAQNSSSTPQTYTTLTYIEGTGTQYIQTDITTALGMTIVSKSYAVCPSSSTGGPAGNGQAVLWSGGTPYAVLVYTSNPRLYVGNGVSLRYYANSVFTSGRYFKIRVVVDGQTASNVNRFAYIVGTSESVFKSTSFIAVPNLSGSQTANYLPIKIFWHHSHSSPTEGKFYGLEITENNTVTHNLVPAMRDSDRAVGVLDQTTNTFYTNAGTGTFNYA